MLNLIESLIKTVKLFTSYLTFPLFKIGQQQYRVVLIRLPLVRSVGASGQRARRTMHGWWCMGRCMVLVGWEGAWSICVGGFLSL